MSMYTKPTGITLYPSVADETTRDVEVAYVLQQACIQYLGSQAAIPSRRRQRGPCRSVYPSKARRKLMGGGSQPPASRLSKGYSLLGNLPLFDTPCDSVEAVSDAIVLQDFVITTGRFAATVPTRTVALSEVELEGEGLPPLREGRVRKGLAGLREIGKFSARKRSTCKQYIGYWNIFVEFCDTEEYDPWVFSATVFELFAGFMYEEDRCKSLDGYTSAFNYVFRLHHQHPPFRQGRVCEAKIQYKQACQARINDRGGETLRVCYPDRAFFILYEAAAQAELEQAWDTCEWIAVILILTFFWIRASSWGASCPGDVRISQGQLILILRQVKCGRQHFEPTEMIVPRPPPGNRAAGFAFGFIERVLRRNPRFSGMDQGITFEKASDVITQWVRALMPRDAVGLPPGSYLASHSSRQTGASHARLSLVPPAPWEWVMNWGGWMSPDRCRGYIKRVSPSRFWAEFYFFLAGNYSGPAIKFGRTGFDDSKYNDL